MKTQWIDGSSPFWNTLSQKEWDELFETSRLTGETLLRFLRMHDFHGEPPAYIEIQVSSGIDRLIRELKKKMKGRAPP